MSRRLDQFDQLWTETEQLRAEMRAQGGALARRLDFLDAMVGALQSEVVKGRGKQTANSAPKTLKPRYVSISPAAHKRRHRLYEEWSLLKADEVRVTEGKKKKGYNRKRGEHSPTTKEGFLADVVDDEGEPLDERDFRRWFQSNNTFQVESPKDRKFRGIFEREIRRLRDAGYRPAGRVSPGTR